MSHTARALLLRAFGLVALLCGASACPAGQPGESYYLLVFGAQRVPNEAKYAHSFGTFVKVIDPGPGATMHMESHTISWLPVTMDVRVRALLPEEGYNFELHPTIRHVLDTGDRVSLWGPYRIEKELYCKALDQIARLQSGKVKYKAVDSGYPTACVSNCIHALSGVTGFLFRPRIASPGWGEVASDIVKDRFEPYILDGQQIYPWVAEALGLRQYPLIFRDAGRRGVVSRRIQFSAGAITPAQ